MRHRPARSGAVLELVQPSLLLDLSCTLICAREAAVMFTPHIAYGMWMRWVQFLPANHSLCWDYIQTLHAKAAQPTYGGAHDSDAAGKKVGDVAFFFCCCHQPDREKACQRREAMSRPRPALLHTCEYNEVCGVEACLCRSLCHTPQRSTCRRPSCRAKCD